MSFDVKRWLGGVGVVCSCRGIHVVLAGFGGLPLVSEYIQMPVAGSCGVR